MIRDPREDDGLTFGQASHEVKQLFSQLTILAQKLTFVKSKLQLFGLYKAFL